jgi:DNA repair photolyase
MAAEASVRVEWLGVAKRNGVETWVSVEPVVDAEEALRAIEAAAPWTDEFRLGKLNHMPEVEKGIDWRDYAERAVGLCQKLGKRYFVKADLAAYLDPR